jgi:8-oxo-dGTP pyrophosphatase MutT (NUDIX family)
MRHRHGAAAGGARHRGCAGLRLVRNSHGLALGGGAAERGRMSSMSPQRWKKLAVRPLLSTRIFEVQSAEFHHPTHPAPRDFFLIAPPDWVNVVALTPLHELVLVRQFRFGTNELSLEIPGGVMEAGEDAVTTGVRELEEETGFTGRGARLLGSVHPNPAIQTNRCHLVLVEHATRTSALAWDPNEELETVVLPVDEVYARAERGEITHSLVLNGLLLFRPLWKKIRRG